MFALKLSADKLNEALEGFWLAARKQKSDGETPGSIRAGTGGKQAFYKASTLENLRHSLNRYLKVVWNSLYYLETL